MIPHHPARTAAVALSCTVATLELASAAVSLADIQFWTGSPDGPGLSAAVLVIDFAHPGAPSHAPSLAWGYRWPAAEPRTGQDLIAAVVAADARLRATGLEFGFIDTLTYDVDLDGAPDFTHPGFDPASGRYSVYSVNNAVVQGTPPTYADAGHILPPNGNPYASESPGSWTISSTGMATRPLADGSWDGWVYASDPAPNPREPVAAMVPEPGVPLLLLGSIALRRRRRTRTQ
jgi:MYXO-CTERM domain-containing protein